MGGCGGTAEQAGHWESAALSGTVKDIPVSLRQGSYILLELHDQGCDGLPCPAGALCQPSGSLSQSRDLQSLVLGH